MQVKGSILDETETRDFSKSDRNINTQYKKSIRYTKIFTIY